MDLKQALNDVARERAKNEQTKELEEDESVTIEFNPELDDVKFWIQRELQYSEGYISSDPETRRLQIELYVNENLRNLNMTCKYGVN